MGRLSCFAHLRMHCRLAGPSALPPLSPALGVLGLDAREKGERIAVGAWSGRGLRLGGTRLPVGYKILLPFLALTLLSGISFAGVAAMELSSSATGEADAALLREADGVNDRLASFSRTELLTMKLLSGSPGLADAVQAHDRDAIQQRLFPMLEAQTELLDLSVSVISRDGNELLTLRLDPSSNGCICTYGRDLAGWPNLRAALGGDSHAASGIAMDLDQSIIYAIGPIASSGEGAVGALVVAEPVAGLVNAMRANGGAETSFYFADGTQLAATSDFPSGHGLTESQRRQVLSGDPVHPTLPILAKYDLAFIPWVLEGRIVGYIGISVPRTLPAVNESLLTLLALTFAAAVTLCTIGGIFVSRAVSRPLANLVEATHEVAGGNLSHRSPVHGDDEIGRLATSFNQMVHALSEKQAEIERTMEGTLETLAAAIDARDPNTHGHSYRVADYAVALGTAAGLPSPTLAVLRRACLVHDIGKIGVPDRVLLKVGALTEDEREILRAHPVIGYQVLRHLAWEREVLDVVRHHHERWDGTGYPDGLAGTGIPQIARLASLADSLDAMVSERLYRPSLGFDEAVDEIRRGAGSQFDPALVEIFLGVEARIRDLVVASAVGIAFNEREAASRIAS